MKKRFFAVVLCLLTLCALLPKAVLAEVFIDTDKPVSLTIHAEPDKVELLGARFDIYLVATMDGNGELAVTDDFLRFNVEIRGKDDEQWMQMLQVLEGWVTIADVKPTDSGVTVDDGLLTFPTGEKALAQGLYLVVGHTHTQDKMVYTPSSFLVLLPARSPDDGSWIYDVTVEPKISSQPEKEDTISRKVLKKWDDKGYENRRPKEITVYLLKDGSIYDTVKLSAANGWSYTWEDLDPNAKWSIAENAMKEYAVEIVREGITFVITNRYADAPPPTTKPGGGKLPQTGQLWWPVPVLFALGLALIVIGMARRRGNGYEE